MGKGFFESDEDYRRRVANEANEHTIREATGRTPRRRYLETAAKYADRIDKEASGHVVERLSGDAPERGWFEDDRDFGDRVTREAHEEIVNHSSGRWPSQGWFESDVAYRRRLRKEANEIEIAQSSGRPPRHHLTESDHAYRSRINQEAQELRTHKATLTHGHRGSRYGGGGFGGGGFEVGSSALSIVFLIIAGILLLIFGSPIWLVWRFFLRKSGDATTEESDVRGAGWVALALFMMLFGTMWLAGALQTFLPFITKIHGFWEGLGFVIGLDIASWGLSVLIIGIDILRRNRLRTVLWVIVIFAALSSFGSYLRRRSLPQLSAANSIGMGGGISYPLDDKMNGSIKGSAFGIRWGSNGAQFSSGDSSRIEYAGLIPAEGTLEFHIEVDGGYRFDDFRPLYDLNEAMIFSTDSQGGDVTWPGTAKLFVRANGDVLFSVATAKYDRPPGIATQAKNTSFRFGGCHSIGVSYGSRGQHIMVDGVLVASDLLRKQALGAAGNHQVPMDIPTIGETVSHFWPHHRYEGGFEGTLSEFRVSSLQRDWVLAKRSCVMQPQQR